MNSKKNEGDEIVRHFMKTGELPKVPTIRLKPEDIISAENGVIKMSILDFLDIPSKVKDNPWSKLNHEQKMLIASNTDGFLEKYNQIILMDVLYHPERHIANFKSKKAKKVVFKKRDVNAVFAMTKITLLYLDVISNPDKYFDSKNEIGKRIVIYLNTQSDFLRTLLEKIRKSMNEIPINERNVNEKPKLSKALISFNSIETITKIHNELKGYFPSKENELLQVLKGKQLHEILLFPHNQNKFVEVFKRLKYNGFLLNTPKEIENWICSNFSYQYQKGNKNEVRNFNSSTVHDILTKDKGEPTKSERICTPDWLPYKNYLKRQREAEKENI
jgi:hypothetical protein